MTHSTNTFYVNDNYPLTAEVFASDGTTPVLPDSATIDIVNQTTGATIVSGDSCTVASGIATYFVVEGSDVSSNADRYIGYMRVEIDSSTTQTIAIPFSVLDKGSYLVVERWRRKVEDSAPTEDHIADEHGRDWVDQAVAYLNGRYSTGYTSTLGLIAPTATSNDVEFIARVASLFARAAWWAGKGNYRDSEISFDGTPFQREWEMIQLTIETSMNEGWWTTDMGGTTFNRDNVFFDGVKLDSPDYWYRWSTEPDPDTEIPI